MSAGNTRSKVWWAAGGLLLFLLGSGTYFLLDHFRSPLSPVNGKDGQTMGPPLFEDKSAALGPAFIYRNGEEAGQYAILESIGGGVALFDFDGDGLVDIFLPGGGYFEASAEQGIKAIHGYPGRLLKNLGNWRFEDVTAKVMPTQAVFYSHGCAVADYDNDGWPDLLVTGWGRVALYHNEPVDRHDPSQGRKLVEVSAKAGLTGITWATSAAWADLDGDGFADLYLCQMGDWSPANHPKCPPYSPAMGVYQELCRPQVFQGLPHLLFRNNGDGTFTEMGARAGLTLPGRKKDAHDQPVKESLGLGVVIADMNGDGRPDIYVANDTVENFLYLNRLGQRPGPSALALQLFPRPSLPANLALATQFPRCKDVDRFVGFLDEVAGICGVALDDKGIANGSMGVDVGDYDGSGLPSIFVTNFEDEFHALYQNGARAQFVYASFTSGISALGRGYVGWGTAFFDLDNDGWQDLVITNGHVIRHPKTAPRKQNAVLLKNQGGRFVDISAQGGRYFQTPHLGRGLAVGDLDNDGRPDLVLANTNEPAALLRNVAPPQNWLGLELQGRNHRDLVGTKVTVEVAGRQWTRFVKGGGSYLSANDSRLLFGLGTASQIQRLSVHWSWGGRQHFDGAALTANRYWQLIEGQPAPRKKLAGLEK